MKCIICEIGNSHTVTSNNGIYELEYSVCDHCKSEFSTPEQLKKNKLAIFDFTPKFRTKSNNNIDYIDNGQLATKKATF